MDNTVKKLSKYIDRLNEEKKPEEHENPVVPPELEKLMNNVRMVRSLKEPALPGKDYPKKVACAVADRLSQKAPSERPRRRWLAGIAAVAAIIVMAVMLNSILPFGKVNVVYAMEQAFQGVRAYHGFLEVVENNAEGIETTQANLEVWADKNGHYYVKELKGSQVGLITVNNGQKKWQLRPEEKQAHVFPAFPDPYRFTFELGKEVEGVKNALQTKVVGEDNISGRRASILEVSPRGGVPYKIWIDKETRLPLQKQSGMQNALQYTVTYTKIDFIDALPAELVAYNLPSGFKEKTTNPEQLVNSIEEAGEAVGFTLKMPENIPEGFTRDGLAVATETKTVRFYYTTLDKQKEVVVSLGKAAGKFKPASTAVLGKVGENIAEIQSPIEGKLGILAGGGSYAGMTDIYSIRWQDSGFEYAVVGNVDLEELASFIQAQTGEVVQTPSEDIKLSNKPKVEVPVDLTVEENEQKSVDAGHSPWRLDPVYVAQVFVSLKISPAGIQGEYPVKYEELKLIQNTGTDAIVEVNDDKTPVSKVYLKKLIRQDSTGIWTVVGYDPS